MRLNRSGLISSIISRLILPGLLIIWLLFFMFGKSPISHSLRGSRSHGDGAGPRMELSDTEKSSIRKLIVVAGHAVMKLSEMDTADWSDNAWYLLTYQRDQSFPEIITSHIKKGIELAQQHKDSMLVFSGGQTRRDVGPLSEAASYYYLSQQKGWSDQVANRIFLEEYARDSYENLIFSICRFKEVMGYYPSSIMVVGFDFKRERFERIHRAAISFPLENFTYVGLKPRSSLFDHPRAVQGEKAALESFSKDIYGCLDPSLKHKRVARNPFARSIPYELSCPDLKDLLLWCGPGIFDKNKLPWVSTL